MRTAPLISVFAVACMQPQPPPAPAGFYCSADSDCLVQWHCSEGTCTPDTPCIDASDCQLGQHCALACDVSGPQIGSCKPGPECSVSSDCCIGSICTALGACEQSCTCTSDSEAISHGFGWCDLTRYTCMPGSDPTGSCAGSVTCTTAPPACPGGQVAVVLAGCYTGACRAIDQCEAPPACTSLQHEADCSARTDCVAIEDGIDCTSPDGTSCTSGSSNCTCQSYVFASCAAK